MLNGAVLAACKPRHRHQEFLSFPREIDKAVPPTTLNARPSSGPPPPTRSLRSRIDFAHAVAGQDTSSFAVAMVI